MDGFFLVIPERLERSTHSLEGCCSIQLSYGTKYSKIQKTYIIAVSNPRPSRPRSGCSILPIAIGMSYGTFYRLQKYIFFQFLQLYFLLIVLFHEKLLKR